MPALPGKSSPKTWLNTPTRKSEGAKTDIRKRRSLLEYNSPPIQWSFPLVATGRPLHHVRDSTAVRGLGRWTVHRLRSRRDIAAGAGRRGDGGPPPRRSTGALHDCLAARGAVFGEVHGYERPRWFARDGVAATDSNGWRRQPWHDAVAAECAAVRDAAGLLDLTAFSKFEVSGRHAVRFLDRISANPPPARVGRVKLAHLLTPAGNFETELTVTRLADDRFYLGSAIAGERRDLDWMRAHVEAGEDVSVRLRPSHEPELRLRLRGAAPDPAGDRARGRHPRRGARRHGPGRPGLRPDEPPHQVMRGLRCGHQPA